MRQGQGIGGEGQDGLRKDMPIVALEIQHRKRERESSHRREDQ
jgi:hypothetical protein